MDFSTSLNRALCAFTPFDDCLFAVRDELPMLPENQKKNIITNKDPLPPPLFLVSPPPAALNQHHHPHLQLPHVAQVGEDAAR